MQIFVLFFEFFKIGLFSVGGGLSTLPFLYAIADKYPWLTLAMVGDMIAISESTPGPLGINMATYAGYQCMGVLGGFIATLGEVLPSFIIIIVIFDILKKFRQSKIVERSFASLRPAVTGMIAAAGSGVLLGSLISTDALKAFDWQNVLRYKEILLFIIIFTLMNKYKKHPAFFIAGAALCGIVFKF